MTAGAFFLANTFGEGSGPTWCSSRGTRSRIDYVFAKMSQMSRISDCKVLEDIDLTMNAIQDHSAVAASFLICPQPARSAARPPLRFNINKTNLQCPYLCQQFQEAMWTFNVEPHEHVDDHLARLNEHARRAALRIFGSTKDTPRKPWISAVTWQIIRQIAPLRRELPSIRRKYHASRIEFYFRSWVCALQHATPSVWAYYGVALDAANAAARCLKAEASICASIFKLQQEAWPSLEADRKAY